MFWALITLHEFLPACLPSIFTQQSGWHLNSRLPSDEAKAYINNIIKHAIKQEVTTVIDREKIKSNYWRDINAEDDQVLATSVDAKAEYLVTGDKLLAQLWSFEGVLIISPSDFVEILERYKSP